jgi:hypothetical protein
MAFVFAWDAWNREHVTKHGSNATDAKYIVEHAEAPFPREVGGSKYLVWGRTAAGEYVEVIFAFKVPEKLAFVDLELSDLGDDRLSRDGFDLHLTCDADEREAAPAVPEDQEPIMTHKDFLKMTSEERDAEARKWEHGVSFDKTRPLSKRSKALWQAAKRGRGRPRKPAGQRARRVLISLEPDLLARAEAFASAKGLDRSKLFALSVRAFMAAEPE